VILEDSTPRVKGVVVDGEQLSAPTVVCAVDAKRVFESLVKRPVLEPALGRRVHHLHSDYPSLFKVDVALSGLPTFERPDGDGGLVSSINISPSMEHVSEAFRYYMAGEMAPDPPLMAALPSVLDRTLAPEGCQTLWLSQWMPAGIWREASDSTRNECADRMVEVFSRYAPNTAGLVIDRAITTPIDREMVTGNWNGHPFQLDMTLDQSMRFRPVPGLASYDTPVQGLYLSGSGTHPGGGVTGIPGYNAAHVVLGKDPRASSSRGLSKLPQRLQKSLSMYRAWRQLRELI
jgi:beta-carotene ketolase (CrtO type)